MTGLYENDPNIRYGLAGALAADRKFDDALALAEDLRRTHPTFRPSEVMLILASALEALNRLDEALVQFQVLSDTYPGEEARWRYGALLKRLGRGPEAQDVFRRMLRNAERHPSNYRDAQKEWLSLARENLQA